MFEANSKMKTRFLNLIVLFLIIGIIPLVVALDQGDCPDTLNLTKGPPTILCSQVSENPTANTAFQIKVTAKDPDDLLTNISLKKIPEATNVWQTLPCSKNVCTGIWNIKETSAGAYTYVIEAKNKFSQKTSTTVTVLVNPSTTTSSFKLRTAAITAEQGTFISGVNITITSATETKSQIGNPFTTWDVPANTTLEVKYEAQNLAIDADYYFFDEKLNTCGNTCTLKTGTRETTCTAHTDQNNLKIFQCRYTNTENKYAADFVYIPYGDPSGDNLIRILNPMFTQSNGKTAIALQFSPTTVSFEEGKSSTIDLNSFVEVNGVSKDQLKWSVANNDKIHITIEGSKATFSQKDLNFVGKQLIQFTVKTPTGESTSNSLLVRIIGTNNKHPYFINVTPQTNELIKLEVGDSIPFSVYAKDPEGDQIQYTWEVNNQIEKTNTLRFIFTSNATGNYIITARIADKKSRATTTWDYSWSVAVYDHIPPTIEETQITPSIQKRLQPVSLTVKAIDNAAIKQVRAKITTPQGKENQLIFLSQPNDFFIDAYIPDEKGEYIVQFTAEDTSGNLQSTEKRFEVTDDPPQFLNATVLPQSQERLLNVTISGMIQEDVKINRAWVDITGPENFNERMTLDPTQSKVALNYNNTIVIGEYTATIFVEDALLQQGSSPKLIFTIEDRQAPKINFVKTSTSIQNRTLPVTMTFNITDDVQIGGVEAWVIFPNQTKKQVPIIPRGDFFVIDTNETDQIGNYSFIVRAKDTSGNLNETQFETFTIVDRNPPQFSNVQITPQVQNRTDPITISGEVTDDVGLSQVTMILATPTGRNMSGPIEVHNGHFKIMINDTTDIGDYNPLLIAIDTSGNQASYYPHFTIRDILPPIITNVFMNLSVQNRTLPIEVSATIIDDIAVSQVKLFVTPPGNTPYQLVMQEGLQGRYKATIADTTKIGNYAMKIVAIDTSNNQANLDIGNAVVQDATPPHFSNTAVVPLIQERTKPVILGTVVDDDVAVQSVQAEMTFPGGRKQTFSVNNNNGAYTLIFADTTSIGNYSVRWIAIDTSNNRNETTIGFSIIDVTPPKITIVSPVNNTKFYGQKVNLSIIAQDDVAMGNCYYDLLNGQVGEIPNCTSINLPLSPGIKTILVWANDTSGNKNQSSATFNMTTSVRLTGKTVASDGSIIQGASVEIQKSNNDPPQFISSDTNGNYFFELVAGMYTINASTSSVLAAPVTLTVAESEYIQKDIVLLKPFEFPISPDTNCIALYHLDNPIALKDSCNTSNGVDHGTVSTTSRTSAFNDARVLNGNQWIGLDNNLTSKMGDLFTIDGWIKTPGSMQADDFGRIIFAHRAANRDVYVGYGRTHEGQGNANKLYFIATGSSGNILYGTADLQPDTWYHVAFVTEKTQMKIYINGILDASGAFSGGIDWINGSPQNAIGVNPREGIGYFIGTIDELRISNTTRTY